MSLPKADPGRRTLEKFERLDWLRRYFARTIHSYQESVGGGPYVTRERSYHYDCLCADFSDAYLLATNVPFQPVVLGAHRCPTLANDLKALYDEGTLTRYRAGVQNMGSGWPKWVWSYSVAPSAIERMRKLRDTKS